MIPEPALIANPRPGQEPPADAQPAAPVAEFGKHRPFPAEVLEVAPLNRPGSGKETLHLGLSLAGSGLSYEPGDALAVIPVNDPVEVDALMAAAKLTGNEEIEHKVMGRRRLADALQEDFDVTDVSRGVLVHLAEACDSQALRELLAEDAKDRLKDYTATHKLVDAVQKFAPAGLSASALSGVLRKLSPRLYSIASSALAHPDEVHLTVAAVRYEANGRIRHGVCSTYLADFVKVADLVKVFVQPNKNFRLPVDPSAPVIMIGPGTGIAPFRAFLEHRTASGHSGKNWLFVGDQHYRYDFLYQSEWEAALAGGTLSRLEVAFSRDQPDKVYVQHRMRERARELYAWLEQGAHVYVCGNANRMAVDVHETLISIIQQQGGITREAAESEVENLKKTKRYLRDVY